MSTAVFTIIAPNRRHQARVLMRSLEVHHPEWHRHVVLIDEAGSADDADLFTTLPLHALGVPDVRRFTFRYTLLELSTAVKPWAFAELLGRGYDRVVYLDPDITVYSRLDELDAVPADTLLVLTPHLTVPSDGRVSASERAVLQSGAYNLGFLAVHRHAACGRFLAWWQSKLEFDCVSEVERGLFVDQKWMDLATGLFPGVQVLRHDGYNVAYWNLRQRRVRGDDGVWRVNDVPLRFFHFSGIDSANPDQVSVHDPALGLEDVGEARALVETYRQNTREAGSASFSGLPCAFTAFADGTRVSEAARRAYRRSDALAHAAGDDPFAHPDVFAHTDDGQRSPERVRAAARAYRLLSSPRWLVRALPEGMRRSMRERLLGPDP